MKLLSTCENRVYRVGDRRLPPLPIEINMWLCACLIVYLSPASPVARLLPSLTMMSNHNNSDDKHDEECPLLFTELNGMVSRPGRSGPGVDLVQDLLRKAQEERCLHPPAAARA
jgi:hypothetical protein